MSFDGGRGRLPRAARKAISRPLRRASTDDNAAAPSKTSPTREYIAQPMQDDTALLRRIQDGDKEAFQTLADRLAPNALALATRVTANRHLAEEAVQEAFLDVWRRCDRFDSKRGGLRQWVLGVVHHKAVDAVRRERSAAQLSSKGLDPMPPPDPEESGWLADRRTRVARAVGDLSPAQREAVMLAYFGGLTYRQVAERLGIPEGTAKSRLRDGLMTLRGLLERHGIGRDTLGREPSGWSQA
jgi:RNA polymerase sigma-70 factor, ECF subfamily